MLHEIWMVALGSILPAIIGLLVGKALAGQGKIWPVLPMDKLIFFTTTWVFTTAVAVVSYMLLGATGLDSVAVDSLAGFLAPMVAGVLFVKSRLQ